MEPNLKSVPKFPWSFLTVTFGFTWLILLPGVLSTRGVFTLPFSLYALVAGPNLGHP